MNGHISETDARQQQWRRVAPLKVFVSKGDVARLDEQLTGDRHTTLVPDALNVSREDITIRPVIDYMHTKMAECSLNENTMKSCLPRLVS